jgi:hypothetical protein
LLAPIPLALVALGFALRVAMGFQSFWLDEAWSHKLATGAASAGAIFEIRHDNNHLLNSLYLRAADGWIGTGHWIGFRVPALIAGGLSLVVLFRLAARFGERTAVVALGLAALSYPLISASAQARGYSLAILCSLLYVALASESPDGRTRAAEWGRSAALLATAVLGLLSHATFVYSLGAAVLWSAVRDRDAGVLLRRHALPIAAAVALYVFFLSQLEMGGGPRYDRLVTVRQAIAQTMALPRRGPLTWLATAAACVVVARGLFLLRGRPDRIAFFFAGVLLLVPGAVVGVSEPRFFYARYLLATFPWLYLLAALVIGEGWERGGVRRAAAALAVTFLLGSNLVQTGRVLAAGRNDYLETLAYIDRQTSGPVLEIGGDHAFRNSTLLRFYAPRITSGRPVVYLKRAQWRADGPEWYLRHDWKAGHDPAPRFLPQPGLEYERVASFEHGPGDGFQWFVYRRVR